MNSTIMHMSYYVNLCHMSNMCGSGFEMKRHQHVYEGRPFGIVMLRRACV